jgi:sugar/nucleoside kinase (ribokinase family)
MKITVTGHLCLDIIRHPDGSETRSYGGIFFSVAALANLLGPKDTVAPVFGVGKSEYDAFLERLKSYPNVDPSGLYSFSGPTNQVQLVYTTASERTECSRHIAEPVPFKRIRPHLDADMILLNMISGFDVTLQTLDEIRMEIREAGIPLYLDVHSLTLGVNEDHTRYHRPVELWRRWLFMIHAAQMNEEEAAILAPDKLDETALANHALALNTRSLIITRGERGCTAFVGEPHSHVHRFEVPGIKVEGAADPTGCGDVFGAAYCAHYLKTKEIVSSVNFANRIAALNAGLAGSSEIDRISPYRLTESAAEEVTS